MNKPIFARFAYFVVAVTLLVLQLSYGLPDDEFAIAQRSHRVTLAALIIGNLFIGGMLVYELSTRRGRRWLFHGEAIEGELEERSRED